MSKVILSAILLLVLATACGRPSTRSEAFSTGLFLATSDQQWTNGIFEIRFGQTQQGTFINDAMGLSRKSDRVSIVTNRSEINDLIRCFQSKISHSQATRLSESDKEWHVFVRSSVHGDAHVRVLPTDKSDVFAVVVNSSGTIAFVRDCLQSGKKPTDRH